MAKNAPSTVIIYICDFKTVVTYPHDYQGSVQNKRSSERIAINQSIDIYEDYETVRIGMELDNMKKNSADRAMQ